MKPLAASLMIAMAASICAAGAHAGQRDPDRSGYDRGAWDDRRDYRSDRAAWRLGGILPPAYRSRPIDDYRRYHLRSPPRGYAWYQAGDSLVLAAVGSGVIFEIIRN